MRRIVIVVASIVVIVSAYFVYALWPILFPQAVGSQPLNAHPAVSPSGLISMRDVATVFALGGVFILPPFLWGIRLVVARRFARRWALLLCWLFPVLLFFPYLTICKMHPEGINALIGVFSYALVGLLYYVQLLIETVAGEVAHQDSGSSGSNSPQSDQRKS